MSKTIVAQKVVNVLNDMAKLDQSATKALVNTSVNVNEAWSSNDTYVSNESTINAIQILNGIFGSANAISVNDVDGVLDFSLNSNIKDVDLAKVIDYMNEARGIDGAAVKSIIEARVPCNDALKLHDNIQVLVDPDPQGNSTNPRVGLLGLINGALGSHENGWPYFSAEYDEEGELQRFLQTPQTEDKKFE